MGNFSDKPIPTKIGSVTVDALVSGSTQLDNDVTEHPVEDGAPISDHVRARPLTMTLECLVSNTPLGAKGADLARGVDAYQAIRKLYDDGTIVTVEVPMAGRITQARSMVVAGISIPFAVAHLNALRFTVSLKRVRVVENKLTRSKAKVTKDKRAGKQSSEGKKGTKEDDKPKSTAKAILDFLRNR